MMIRLEQMTPEEASERLSRILDGLFETARIQAERVTALEKRVAALEERLNTGGRGLDVAERRERASEVWGRPFAESIWGKSALGEEGERA